MIDLSKLIQGKHLTETELQVLNYIIDHIDEVLTMGVRAIARENFTSTSTIMRLTKKMGYTGFVDMHYRLRPLVKSADAIQRLDMQFIDNTSVTHLMKYISYQQLKELAQKLFLPNGNYIFIYATGFSAIAAEYLYKKLLVLGKRCILAKGGDSVGIFENNLDNMELLIVISKSGETQLVADKVRTAKENGIQTAAFTGNGENTIGRLADLWFQIEDSAKLDDRNMMANTFFPNVMMLIELMVYEYHRILVRDSNKA